MEEKFGMGTLHRTFLLLAAVSALFVSVAAAQQSGNSTQAHVHCRGDLCTLDQVGTNPAVVHSAANVFESEIGNLLRDGRSLRVVGPKVNLWVWKEDGKDHFEIRWSARLMPTDSKHADHHFARMGTLLKGETEESTAEAVRLELAKSGKVNALLGAYGGVECRFDGVNNPGSSWFIQECFATGR